MKKRLISLLLVLCMMCSVFSPVAFAAENQSLTATQANPFNDVKEGNWYYDAVQYARVNGFF